MEISLKSRERPTASGFGGVHGGICRPDKFIQVLGMLRVKRRTNGDADAQQRAIFQGERGLQCLMNALYAAVNFLRIA